MRSSLQQLVKEALKSASLLSQHEPLASSAIFGRALASSATSLAQARTAEPASTSSSPLSPFLTGSEASSPFLVPITERGPAFPDDPTITGRYETVVQGRPVFFEGQGSKSDIRSFPVYNWNMEIVRSIDLPGDIFNERIRHDIMHRYYVWQMAKRRQGTHKTLGRGEVRGGGRKPWPQKGTGMAPLGSIRAPQCRGGGHVKEKVTRDWSIMMNVKERRFGLRSALASKVFEGRLLVFESLDSTGRTKDVAAKCAALWPEGSDGKGKGGESLLLVDRGKEDPKGGVLLRRGALNIPGLEVLPQSGLQVRSLLRRRFTAITEEALWDLVERLRRPYPLHKWRPLPIVPWPAPPLEALEGLALPLYRQPKVLPWMVERGWDPVERKWRQDAEEGKEEKEAQA